MSIMVQYVGLDTVRKREMIANENEKNGERWQSNEGCRFFRRLASQKRNYLVDHSHWH